MVVGKLRMKNTDDTHQPSQIHKQNKRRQRTRSPSIDPPPEPYGFENVMDEFPSGSSSASRAFQADKGKARQDPRGGAGDELVIQWTTTSSSLANQLLSIPSTSSSDFQAKLRDALNAENDDLRLESLLEDEAALPRRWQDHQSRNHAHSDLNGHQLGRLESEEYEEYIRKRMWSQSHRKNYLYLKDQEEQKRKAREEAHQARKKHRADLKLRAERESLKQINQKLKSRQRCRDSYTRRWELLNCLLNSDGSKADNKEDGGSDSRQKLKEEMGQVVEFEEIPWPVYSSGVEEEESLPGINRLNINSIREFLVGHLPNNPSNTPARKKIIRNALLAYHPDRFDRLLLRIKDRDNSTLKAKEWGLRVSQVLNELNQSIN
ncbi:hypothetical protein PSTG_02325 [Puccinia striiformis f. sp. tritici PST-78]|uniref:Uncharacterized protein n=1 Tax=Puccinia striiformis f. sp. tritici PST-78 TaxID=1165861 RepID=A0A0L0VYR9_9BASI|nr:hypothetical protein PSTG_02325 [Puccinia striiformis f. sp. tritici PST-78]